VLLKITLIRIFKCYFWESIFKNLKIRLLKKQQKKYSFKIFLVSTQKKFMVFMKSAIIPYNLMKSAFILQ